MDRGAWQATVGGVAESDAAECMQGVSQLAEEVLDHKPVYSGCLMPA